MRFLLPLLLLAGTGCRAAHDRRELVEDDGAPVFAAAGDTDAVAVDWDGDDPTGATDEDKAGDTGDTRETEVAHVTGKGDPVAGDHDATRALVKAVQLQLIALGFAAGYPDGEIGERTRDALSAFQREQHLRVTGEANVETLAALFRAEPNDPDGEIVPTRGVDAGIRGPKGRPKLSRVRTLGFGAGVGFLVASGLAALAFMTRRR